MHHAFILAGGLGTRLRPYTTILPKPLIPLGDRSIVERVLVGVRDAGVTRATVSLGYLGHLVEAVLGDGSALGLELTYTRESEPLGTAGALSLIGDNVSDDDIVLVINGDTFTTLDFGHLLSWFDGTSADAAMVCVQRDVTIDYGVVDIDPDGQLIGIREKPHLQHTVSTGINLLRGSTLRTLDGGRIDMPVFLTGLQEAGRTVLCRVVDDLWMDLGRQEDLAAANDLIHAEGFPL